MNKSTKKVLPLLMAHAMFTGESGMTPDDIPLSPPRKPKPWDKQSLPKEIRKGKSWEELAVLRKQEWLKTHPDYVEKEPIES
jgi:hypothetical protein